MVDFHLPQRWAPPRRPAARGMALPLEPSAAIFASFAAGAAPGLYALDLHGMTSFFPWFAPLRTFDTAAAHVLFGVVAATAYRHLVPLQR